MQPLPLRLLSKHKDAAAAQLLGFGPHDGSAPGGGGAARDGWTNPRSQHYYLGRTQEQAAEERDPSKYDGWNFNEVYYEGPGAGLQRRKKSDEATG